MAKRRKKSKAQKRGKLPKRPKAKSAKRGQARISVPRKAAKRVVTKAKRKRPAAKKAAPTVKQPVAPVAETVVVDVIEQPAPGVISVTEVEETRRIS